MEDNNISNDKQREGHQHPLLDLTKFRHGHLIREIVQMYDKIDSPVLKATVTTMIATAAYIDFEL